MKFSFILTSDDCPQVTVTGIGKNQLTVGKDVRPDGISSGNKMLPYVLFSPNYNARFSRYLTHYWKWHLDASSSCIVKVNSDLDPIK